MYRDASGAPTTSLLTIRPWCLIEEWFLTGNLECSGASFLRKSYLVSVFEKSSINWPACPSRRVTDKLSVLISPAAIPSGGAKICFLGRPRLRLFRCQTVAGETTQMTSQVLSPTVQNLTIDRAGKAKLSPLLITNWCASSSRPSVPCSTSPHLPPSMLE